MTDRRDKRRRRLRLRKIRVRVSELGSFIGLISIVDQLKLWIEMMSRLLAVIRDFFSPLAEWLAVLGRAVHAVLETFRAVFHPPLDFLLQWLPFEVPGTVKDLVVVAAFIALGHVRADRREPGELEAVMGREMHRLALEYRAAGIDFHPHSLGEVLRAVNAYRMLSLGASAPPPRYFKRRHAREQLELERVWQRARDYYGPELEAYAAAAVDKPIVSPETEEFLFRALGPRFVVWLLGLATATLVAFDYWLAP